MAASERLPATLLRIHLGESDRHHGRPVYEVIVHRAHAMGLAGATVLRGPMSFGARSIVHTSKVLRLSEELPMVVEIIDDRSKLEAFLPVLDEVMTSGVATLHDVEVIHYRNGD